MWPSGETTWMAGMFQTAPGGLGSFFSSSVISSRSSWTHQRTGSAELLERCSAARVTSRDLGDQSVPAQTTIMYLLTVFASSLTAW
ncbi:hypothetical protein J5W01_00125 [Akkermansia muciniphila]|nr:hypothetical protein [Akkermansia muciniphila]